MTRCIFCRITTAGEPEEHIAPEGLIGDLEFFSNDPARPRTERLVLANDEVCKACNTERTSKLDEHLQKQLAFFKPFLNRVGTKRGRPATAILPGFFATGGPTGPKIVFNATDTTVRHEGNVIPPSKGQRQAVSSLFDKSEGTIRVRFPMKFTKRLIRALHKVAFELLCKHRGPEYVLHERFDPVRDYILYGKGVRWMAAPRGNVAAPGMFLPGFQLLHDAAENWIVEMRFGSPYVVDLSRYSDAMRRLAHHEDGRAYWWIYPTDIPVPLPSA